jgi:hypothetical protein
MGIVHHIRKKNSYSSLWDALSATNFSHVFAGVFGGKVPNSQARLTIRWSFDTMLQSFYVVFEVLAGMPVFVVMQLLAPHFFQLFEIGKVKNVP